MQHAVDMSKLSPQAPPIQAAILDRLAHVARRQGCGAKLIEAVATVARERGCHQLYWTTKEDNVTARSLYDRIARFNGFIRYDYALETR